MPKGTHLSGADRSVNPRLVTSISDSFRDITGRTYRVHMSQTNSWRNGRIPLSSDGVYRDRYICKPAKEHLCAFVLICRVMVIDFEYRYHGNNSMLQKRDGYGCFLVNITLLFRILTTEKIL